MVEEKAAEAGKEDLIEETTIDKHAAQEAIMASTTEAKVYDQIPTSLSILQEPTDVVVGQRPKQGFQVCPNLTQQ